ncbi:MAG: transcription elongation factor GreB [Betaproteobacteria bacterium]
MNKAFTRESDDDSDDDVDAGAGAPLPLPPGQKNYITPGGYARLKAELEHLVDKERPEVVGIVSWAAGNGDRSENGDYIYGKKRLREIDRRIRFLVRRLDLTEVVDPVGRGSERGDQIFFGATVTVADRAGHERTVSIVGIDETDTGKGYVSWISPMARALLKARSGDTVTLVTPGGVDDLEILDVRYVPLSTGNVSPP